MEQSISKIRIILLKVIYSGTFLIPGLYGLYYMFKPHEIDFHHFITYGFWFAYGFLSLLGLKKPLKMLPIILLQIIYKTAFIISFLIHQFSREAPVWIPMEVFDIIFYAGIIIFDCLVVPWKYVVNEYIKK